MIKIGADPELFVYTMDHKPVSAHDLLPGNKLFPYPVTRGAMQVDGVAAEFNIEPAETEDEFLFNIRSVRDEMLEELRKQGNYILRAQPTIRFTRKQWNAIPDSAKELGCEPDFSAYTLEANPKPHTNKFMRTGSGHVHISWDDKSDDPFDTGWMAYCADLVKHLDHHLMPQAVKWDKDRERMELYGKAGAFRPKSYGVEYRVLSNAWLATEARIRYVFRTVHLITTKWASGFTPNEYKVEDYAA